MTWSLTVATVHRWLHHRKNSSEALTNLTVLSGTKARRRAALVFGLTAVLLLTGANLTASAAPPAPPAPPRPARARRAGRPRRTRRGVFSSFSLGGAPQTTGRTGSARTIRTVRPPPRCR